MKEERKTPKCIGIIMDGNRRWAKELELDSTAGHTAGYEKLKEVLAWAKDSNIKYVIAYAFSTENWKRDPREVKFLMDLFRKALDQSVEDFKDKNVRLKIMGNKEKLPKDLQKKIIKAEEETKNGELCLVLAISYGGRAEILSAIKELIETKTKKEILKLTEEKFSNFLWTKDIPDPDLIIRTSGELRTSNFLPWQSAYSEWFFLPMYWPAITREDFDKVIDDFGNRKRRLGK
ncbi:MAG: polyprenyl diphosphate synthase [bacterium]